MGQDRVHPDRDDGFRTSFGAVFRDMCHMSGRLPAISRGVRFGVPRQHGVHAGDFRGGTQAVGRSRRRSVHHQTMTA